MNRYLAVLRRVLLCTAALLPLATLSVPASAAAVSINLSFQGGGPLVFDPLTSSGAWIGDFNDVNYPDLTSLVAYTYDMGTGLLQGTVEFFPLADLANSLVGRMDALLQAGGFDEGSTGTLAVSYTIESGTGLFAGASGTGNSTVSFDAITGGFANFSETGVLAVAIAAVPEPTGLALSGVALLALLATRRKAAPLN